MSTEELEQLLIDVLTLQGVGFGYASNGLLDNVMRCRELLILRLRGANVDVEKVLGRVAARLEAAGDVALRR